MKPFLVAIVCILFGALVACAAKPERTSSNPQSITPIDRVVRDNWTLPAPPRTVALAQAESQPMPIIPPLRQPLSESTMAGSRRTLTLKITREMGMSVSNLAVLHRELQTEGEIDSDSSSAEIAVALVVRLTTKNPTAFVGRINWDGALAFVEKLLPLVEKEVGP